MHQRPKQRCSRGASGISGTSTIAGHGRSLEQRDAQSNGPQTSKAVSSRNEASRQLVNK